MPVPRALLIPVFALLPAMTAAGQDTQPAADAAADMPDARERPGIMFQVGGGYEYRFRAGNSGRGAVESVGSATFNVSAHRRIGDDLTSTASALFRLDDYSFSADTSLGPGPWSDIYTLEVYGVLNWEISNKNTIFGGPIVQFARESGADWENSFTAGGFIGATHRFDDLTIGGGVGVVTQLEDDLRIVPIFIVEWPINDWLRLTSSGGGSASGRQGLELIYMASEDIEIAIGGGFQFRRFRLDDAGLAPGGVGEDTGTPIYARLGWDLSPQVSIDIFGGMITGGEMEVINSSGNGLRTSNLDNAPFGGAAISIRF